MGGRRLTPGEAVVALREAIAIIRDLWDTEATGIVRHEGRFYTAVGTKRGPKPAHDISIWVGSYKPKMLELTGAVADGWLPSLEYLPRGVDSLPELNARIDEAAAAAGRSPTAIRRLLNVMNVQFSTANRGVLNGPPQQWVEQLADLTLTHGVSAVFIGGDDHAMTERFAAEVVPAVRELVARERGGAAVSGGTAS
jgi:hypothetical protein